jgi:hypothetical protein
LSNYRLGKTLGVGSFGKVISRQNKFILYHIPVLLHHPLGESCRACYDWAQSGHQNFESKENSCNGHG